VLEYLARDQRWIELIKDYGCKVNRVGIDSGWQGSDLWYYSLKGIYSFCY
jgi:hypothetical protein